MGRTVTVGKAVVTYALTATSSCGLSLERPELSNLVGRGLRRSTSSLPKRH